MLELTYREQLKWRGRFVREFFVLEDTDSYYALIDFLELIGTLRQV